MLLERTPQLHLWLVPQLVLVSIFRQMQIFRWRVQWALTIPTRFCAVRFLLTKMQGETSCSFCPLGQFTVSNASTHCFLQFVVNPALSGIVIALTCVGVAFCCILSVVFARYREESAVLATSPNIMLAIIFACVVSFCSMLAFVLPLSEAM